MSTLNGGIELETLLSEPKANGSQFNSKPHNWNIKLDEGESITDREMKALENVKFIADHMQGEYEEKQVEEDWKYVAMVVDRFFLWVFSIVCCLGTLSIILQAPTLFDDTKPHPSNAINY